MSTSAAYAALLIRRLFMRYLALPRLTSIVYISEPDPKTGRIQHYEYLLEPYYQSPTFWNRWGPIALLTRLLGDTSPGRNSSPRGTSSRKSDRRIRSERVRMS